eukprot:scaffold189505_cov29-Tisochrysis_lutea.AAC.2
MGGIMSRWEAVGVVGSNAQDTQGAQASTLPYPYPVLRRAPAARKTMASYSGFYRRAQQRTSSSRQPVNARKQPGPKARILACQMSLATRHKTDSEAALGAKRTGACGRGSRGRVRAGQVGGIGGESSLRRGGFRRQNKGA